MRAHGALQPDIVAPQNAVSDAELSVEPLETGARAREGAFWPGLVVAATLHALLLVGIGKAAPRHVGSEDGSVDGIAINVVSEAELRGTATVAEAAPPPPAQSAPPAPPQLKPSQQEDSPPVAEQQPQPQIDAAPVPPEPAKADKSVNTAIENEMPNLLALSGQEPAAQPKQSPKQSPKEPPKEQPAAQPRKQPPPSKPAQQPTQSAPQKVAKLDLATPPPAFSGGAGGAGRRAGLERPPGITRSGANDEFARNVVRALQQTMPQLRDVLGRVTVRILLNENGNVVDVQVLRPSSIAQIDQSVVFAARQTSYPFPPPNSNVADRTFLITYIYH